MVMATGIVSLAWHFQGVRSIAIVLFWVNLLVWLVLWAITLGRIVRFRTEFLNDMTSHARGAPFLTKVAATCVLGKQFVVLTPFLSVGKWMWLLGLLLWCALIYTFFTAVTVREPKPKLEGAISGAWLLTVVATESLCTLGTMVARSFAGGEVVLFTSLAAYFLGAMFYIVLITLILYRWMFKSMAANMLTPPYWINMGALAITTLGGARLLKAVDPASPLAIFNPFITGFTMFFWATATWWIPLLVVVGVWRHLWQRVPLAYDPQYWSLVFPLGMYSVATYVMAEAMGLPFLAIIPRIFAVAALAAWVVTFAGLCLSFAKALRRNKPDTR